MTEIPDFDPDGPQLIYVSVADHLSRRIGAGEFAPGTRLAPERELASEYSVAYLTVRRAMRVLRDRGLIETIHGRGTYVKALPSAPVDEPE